MGKISKNNKFLDAEVMYKEQGSPEFKRCKLSEVTDKGNVDRLLILPLNNLSTDTEYERDIRELAEILSEFSSLRFLAFNSDVSAIDLTKLRNKCHFLHTVYCASEDAELGGSLNIKNTTPNTLTRTGDMMPNAFALATKGTDDIVLSSKITFLPNYKGARKVANIDNVDDVTVNAVYDNALGSVKSHLDRVEGELRKLDSQISLQLNSEEVSNLFAMYKSKGFHYCEKFKDLAGKLISRLKAIYAKNTDWTPDEAVAEEEDAILTFHQELYEASKKQIKDDMSKIAKSNDPKDLYRLYPMIIKFLSVYYDDNEELMEGIEEIRNFLMPDGQENKTLKSFFDALASDIKSVEKAIEGLKFVTPEDLTDALAGFSLNETDIQRIADATRSRFKGMPTEAEWEMIIPAIKALQNEDGTYKIDDICDFIENRAITEDFIYEQLTAMGIVKVNDKGERVTLTIDEIVRNAISAKEIAKEVVENMDWSKIIGDDPTMSLTVLNTNLKTYLQKLTSQLFEDDGTFKPASEIASLVCGTLQEMYGEDFAKISEIYDEVVGLNRIVSGVKTEVEEVKGDVSSIRTDVSRIGSDVSGVKTDVAQVKGDIAQVKTDMSNMYSAVTALSGQVSNLQKTNLTIMAQTAYNTFINPTFMEAYRDPVLRNKYYATIGFGPEEIAQTENLYAITAGMAPTGMGIVAGGTPPTATSTPATPVTLGATATATGGSITVTVGGTPGTPAVTVTPTGTPVTPTGTPPVTPTVTPGAGTPTTPVVGTPVSPSAGTPAAPTGTPPVTPTVTPGAGTPTAPIGGTPVSPSADTPRAPAGTPPVTPTETPGDGTHLPKLPKHPGGKDKKAPTTKRELAKVKVLRDAEQELEVLKEEKQSLFRRIGNSIKRHPMKAIGIGLGVTALAVGGVGIGAVLGAGGIVSALGLTSGVLANISSVGSAISTVAGIVGGAGVLTGTGLVIGSNFKRKAKLDREKKKVQKSIKKCEKKREKIEALELKSKQQQAKIEEFAESHREAGKLAKTTGLYKILRSRAKKKYKKTKEKIDKAERAYARAVDKVIVKKVEFNLMEKADVDNLALNGDLQRREVLKHKHEVGELDDEDFKFEMEDLEEETPGISGVSAQLETFDGEVSELISHVSEKHRSDKANETMREIKSRNTKPIKVVEEEYDLSNEEVREAWEKKLKGEMKDEFDQAKFDEEYERKKQEQQRRVDAFKAFTATHGKKPGSSDREM